MTAPDPIGKEEGRTQRVIMPVTRRRVVTATHPAPGDPELVQSALLSVCLPASLQRLHDRPERACRELEVRITIRGNHFPQSDKVVQYQDSIFPFIPCCLTQTKNLLSNPSQRPRTNAMFPPVEFYTSVQNDFYMP
jgi:hypothetical protein